MKMKRVSYVTNYVGEPDASHCSRSVSTENGMYGMRRGRICLAPHPVLGSSWFIIQRKVMLILGPHESLVGGTLTNVE